MGILLTADTSATGAAAGGGIIMIVYIVLIFAFIYFFMIRPQKKEQKKMAAMSALEIGDCVLTNSGFYGIVIDITEDTVIVEFGNNKNCRIPMQKTAIAQVEKADNE